MSILTLSAIVSSKLRIYYNTLSRCSVATPERPNTATTTVPKPEALRGEERSISAKCWLTTKVSVKNIGFVADFAVRDEVDHASHRLAFVDGIRDHPLQASAQAYCLQRPRVGNTIGAGMVAII